MTIFGDVSHILPLHLPDVTAADEKEEHADIVLFSPEVHSLPKHCTLFLFDATRQVKLPKMEADFAVSCGMCAHDSLSFSSILPPRALLTLMRSFVFDGVLYEPLEAKVPFDTSLSLYRNLTCAFVRTLANPEAKEELA
ncbi:MAG: hypothetical protein IKT43_03160 [Clostridia bacterium]|nr:hypothetical protein [Clostridia bacterium]